MSTLHGQQTGLILQEGTSVLTDNKGLSTGRAAWKIPADALDAAAITASRIFPIATYAGYLNFEKSTVTFDGTFAVITTEFAGTTYSAEPTGDEGVSYELIIGTAEEPIETHPDFISKIGGQPSSPKNGAIFLDPETGLITEDDAKGVFHAFNASSAKAGMISYLAGRNITFRKNWTQDSKPSSLGGVGGRDTPSAAPSVSGGYDWLYIGMSYVKRGDHYSVSREWKLSGPGGWDSDVY